MTADMTLVPIWNEKRPTASRVRRRVGAVMKWAVAKGYRADHSRQRDAIAPSCRWTPAFAALLGPSGRTPPRSLNLSLDAELQTPFPEAASVLHQEPKLRDPPGRRVHVQEEMQKPPSAQDPGSVRKRDILIELRSGVPVVDLDRRV